MSINLPTPSGYFKHKHGQSQQAAATIDSIEIALPNELFTIQNNIKFDPSSAFPTTTILPRHTSLQRDLKIPMHVHFSPFSTQSQLVQRPPVRCKRCKAYLNKYIQITGNEYICCICQRKNELPEHFRNEIDSNLNALKSGAQFPELQESVVDYQVTDLQYLPASADAAGLQSELLNPGEVSHVSCNVFAHPSIKQTIKQLPNRIYTSSKNLQHPQSKRLDEKQIPVDFDYLNIQNSVQQNIDKPITTVQMVIIPVSFNTVYQGLFATALQVLTNIVNSQAENSVMKIIPIFYLNNAIAFDNQLFQLNEMISDPIGGEYLLPLPLDKLHLKKSNVQQFVQQITTYFYNAIKEEGLLEKQVFKFGEVLACCISSMQRAGGIVTLILADQINAGVGRTPSEDRKNYEFTNQNNTDTCQERLLFDNDLFYIRLADEAAAHNVAVNVIALPFNYQHLGLNQISPLLIKTSGQLFYNKIAAYIQTIDQTSNNIFLQNSLNTILHAEAIHCTLTVRTSTNVNLMVYENQQLQLKQKFVYKDELFGSFQKISDVEFNFCQFLKDQTFGIGIQVSNAESTQENAYLQMACLYTSTLTGRRQVRVHTLQFKFDNTAGTIFNATNQYAIASYLCRKTAMTYLNAGELITNNRENICKNPISDANFKGEFQANQKVTIQENKITGNYTEKEIEMLQKELPTASSSLKDGQFKLLFQQNYQEIIYQNFIDILASFKSLCGSQATDKLLVPNTQQLLPLYICALQRSAVFHGHRQKLEGGLFTADQRIAEALFYLNCSVFQCCRQLIANVQNITEYISNDEIQGLPIPYQCNSMLLKDVFKSAYLYCTSQYFILNVGKGVDVSVLQQIFGQEVTKYEDIQNKYVIQNTHNPKVNALLDCLREVHGYKNGIYIATAGSQLEDQVRWFLVEDQMTKDKSYYDFLNQVKVSMAAK